MLLLLLLLHQALHRRALRHQRPALLLLKRKGQQGDLPVVLPRLLLSWLLRCLLASVFVLEGLQAHARASGSSTEYGGAQAFGMFEAGGGVCWGAFVWVAEFTGAVVPGLAYCCVLP
jgi:hypothetical protein